MNYTIFGLDVDAHEAREIAQEFQGVLEARGHDVDVVEPHIPTDDDPLMTDGGQDTDTPRIVIEDFEDDDARRVIEVLTANGIKREVIDVA